MLNGHLISSKTALYHGDKILFGNSNLYVVVYPWEEVTPEMQDYETIMQMMVSE